MHRLQALLQKPWLHYVLLLLIALAFVYSFLTDPHCTELICRGDFPAFYTAGQLAFSQELYHAEVQQHFQQLSWPSLSSAYLYFAYPPYTAMIYAPFSALPPLAAKCAALIISASALIALSHIQKTTLPTAATLVALLLCPQVLIALAAGQNTTISMLLAYFCIAGTTAWSRGLSAGLWWFKPQFAAFACLGFLFTKDYRAFFWSLVPLSLYYLLATSIFSWQWPIHWIAVLQEYQQQETIINGLRSISLFSVFQVRGAEALGVLAVVALCLHLLWYSVTRDNRTLMMLWLVAALLLSPRTMYYDFGIVLAAILALGRGQKSLFISTIAASFAIAIVSLRFSSVLLCLLLLSLYFLYVIKHTTTAAQHERSAKGEA